MTFINREFPAPQRRGAPALRDPRGAPADHRLPQPPAAEGHRREPPVRQPVRDLARGRSLQVAGDAGQRRRGAATAPATRDPYEKFLAWAATVPRCLRNPLYHWTHLELSRYFGIDDLLDETTAPGIWQRANERLRVRRAADARHPEEVRRESALHDRRSGRTSRLARDNQRLRPRDAGLPDVPAGSRAGRARARRLQPVGRQARGACRTPPSSSSTDFLDALRARHQAFHDAGGRLSDHGLSVCYADPCTDAEPRPHFDRARAGQINTPEQARAFASFMMVFFGRLDAEKGWTKQLHLGALRNVNTRAHASPRTRRRLRLDRRLAAGRAARRVPRSAQPGRLRCRGSSSTTSTRRTTTRWRR